MIGGLIGREDHVVVKAKKLFVERRVVGEDVGWVVVDFETVFHALDDDRGGAIANHPVERRSRELIAKVDVGDIEVFELSFDLVHSGAFAEDVGDELKGSYVVFVRIDWVVNGIASEIKTSHTDAFFVGGIIVKWIAVYNISHAIDSVMSFGIFYMTKFKIVIPGSHGDSLVERDF